MFVRRASQGCTAFFGALEGQCRQADDIGQGGESREITMAYPADIGDAAFRCIPHILPLGQCLTMEGLDFNLSTGGFFNLFKPGFDTMDGAPSGVRVLLCVS